jgi:hypothetical protein
MSASDALGKCSAGFTLVPDGNWYHWARQTGIISRASLRVQNVGNLTGEYAGDFVTKVGRLNRDGTRDAADGFIPSNLRWADTDPDEP